MHSGVGNSGDRIMARQTLGAGGSWAGLETDGFNGEGGKAQAGEASSFVE